MKQRRFDEFTQIFLLSASQMAYLEDASNTQGMLQKFYELFNYFIKNNRTDSLSNEINHLQKYIDIQKIRYGSRFETNFINQPSKEEIFIQRLGSIDFFDLILNDALVKYETIINFNIEIVYGENLGLKIELKTEDKKEEFYKSLAEERDMDV